MNAHLPLGVSGPGTLALYNSRASGHGNIVASPLNMTDALVALCHGLGGNSAAQVREALALENNPSAFVQARDSLMALGSSGGPTTLNMATRLWLADTLPVRDRFREVLRENYQAGFGQFAMGGDALREEVNKWISENTKGQIPELLPTGSVDGLTQLVLASALYAQVKWAKPFDTSDTTQGQFRTLGGSLVTASLMSQNAPYAAIGCDFFDGDSSAVKAVKMPFSDGRLAFYAVMPNETHTNFDEFEKEMMKETGLPSVVTQLDNIQHPGSVHVILPRFEVAEQFDLVSVLRSMGITDIFSFDFANFAGVHPDLASRRLFVSAAFHGAKLKVDENGAEGSAATAFAVSRGMTPAFNANRPFIYLIRDTESGEVLFVGRIANPSNESGTSTSGNHGQSSDPYGSVPTPTTGRVVRGSRW